VKKAWKTFHSWWKKTYKGHGKPVSRSAMPANVAEALKIITEAPIPDHPDKTGADSCYVNGVNSLLID
jgi:hypothetical protein